MLRTIMFGIIFLATSTAGQSTTQPAPSSWNDFVTRAAQVMITSNRTDPTWSEIGDDVIVKQVGKTSSDSLFHLREQTDGLTIISSRGYAWPAETIASDLSSAVREMEDLPGPMRKQFELHDDAQIRRGNSVAQQWVGSVLQPSGDQLVGLIVLWERPPAANAIVLGGSVDDTKQPMFVLVKAQRTGEDSYHLTQISYGDLRQILR